ncbi:heparin lyase I family protein [Streptomyces sp. TS71-3]|uniref:heparin lyase I family protein n=1 Tax=Streptomyces sp. TS71-3 TaxID=2733862 RepID=UPI001B2D8F36|nr:heparin lyase I family protein [Streptomyces sp. TS71-3]GHJ41334.1 hypothetical protein Sm713_69430 [Streptomyces sp. TS71-3]
MLRRQGLAGSSAIAVLCLVLAAGQASASTIWSADAASGGSPAQVFGNIGTGNCETNTISAVTDSTRGKVWRYLKPKGSNRCESRGVRVDGEMYRFTNNATYYIGWQFKLSSTTDNNAVFQWKSYEDHIQNYPVVLKMIGGRLTMLQRQPDGVETLPWSQAISANQWNHVVLGIHTSSELKGGWVELYVNGRQQTFEDGQKRYACRTWDSYNDVKWGVYGASGTEVSDHVDDQRIGTAYADVD